MKHFKNHKLTGCINYNTETDCNRAFGGLLARNLRTNVHTAFVNTELLVSAFSLQSIVLPESLSKSVQLVV